MILDEVQKVPALLDEVHWLIENEKIGFILMELVAHAAYTELNYRIRFWRTKSGQEVDFVLGDGEIAIEVKGSDRIDRTDLRGMNAFAEDHKPRHSILVCTESRERLTADGIRIQPWRRFLEKLWAGEIIN